MDPKGGRLFLNQAITVYFSAPIDWSTVTRDTVRIEDSRGQPVDPAEGKLELSDVALTFRPRPPVTASLDDGTWRPGETYRLRVSGFPSVRSLRSRSGAILDPSFSISYGVVDPAALPSGHRTPYLPVHVGAARMFYVKGVTAADDGKAVRVRFTAPLFPPSVTREAFRLIGSDGNDVPILRAQVLRGRWLDDQHPGCTVDLVLEQPISPDAARPYWLVPRREEGGVRDYFFDRVGLLPGQESGLQVEPEPGRGSALTRVEFERETDLDAAETRLLEDTRVDGVLRCDHGVLRPVVLPEAGSGVLGPFRPSRDTVLAPDIPFDPGDGRALTVAGGDFHFSSFEVPRGVTVEIKGPAPVILRSQRRIRVDGRLLVSVPPSPSLGDPRGVERTTDRWFHERLALGRAAGGGCLLVTSGHLDVHGEVVGDGIACLLGGFVRMGRDGKIHPGTEVAGPDPHPLGEGRELVVTRLQLGRISTAPMPEVFRAACVTRAFEFARVPEADSAQVRFGPRASDPRVLVQTAVARPDPAKRVPGPDWAVSQGFTSKRFVALPNGARFARFRITLEVASGDSEQPPSLEWLELATP